jgi:CubicO group peptidase (beta-lactamase class C family)
MGDLPELRTMNSRMHSHDVQLCDSDVKDKNATDGNRSPISIDLVRVVHAAPADKSADIDSLMSTMYKRGQFNGAILVAVHGNTIYREGFGKANFQTGTDFTPETPSDIRSVTKQFTAMSVMMLAERGKLSYDDPVSTYIPEFSRSANLSQITLRQLLNHVGHS